MGRERSPENKDVTTHTLGHTYATDLLEDGLDIVSIKELRGQAHIETTFDLPACQPKTVQPTGYTLSVVRPVYQVADILNSNQYRLQDYCGNSWQQRTLHAVRKCRTAELGGHIEQCDSCRNRHCPKCQGEQREAWIQRGRSVASSLLPRRFHVTTAD